MAEIAATSSQHDVPRQGAPSRAAQVVLWLPGLLVAVSAIAATAHGLYEVAIAAHVPPTIAWLYPVITDGLALVAYAAAARLQGPARRYSWAVVTIAAGLSGLAQAFYLAGDATVAAPAALRFGVGAWPAIAAAIVAHLLHLLATTPGPPQVLGASPDALSDSASPSGRTPDLRPDRAPSDAPLTKDVTRSQGSPRRSTTLPRSPHGAPNGPQPIQLRPRVHSADAPARDRARTAADQYTRHHGTLPTVTQLQDQADVSRGTAGEVLKAMREEARAPQPGPGHPGRTPQATGPGPKPPAGGHAAHDRSEVMDVLNGRASTPVEVRTEEVRTEEVCSLNGSPDHAPVRDPAPIRPA